MLRKEFQHECYEIDAPVEYIPRPDPFEVYNFIIDISPNAIQSGLVKSVALAVQTQL